MARTKVTFHGVEGMFTLPAPYGGAIGPGQSAILADDVATVLANIGVPLSQQVTLTQEPESTPLTSQALNTLVSAQSTLLLYADAVNGNDASNGLTATSPVKTLAKLRSLIPGMWRSVVNVYLAAGTYEWNDPATTVPNWGMPTGPDAYPIAFVGGFDSLYGSKTSAATDGTYVDGSFSTTIDVNRGDFIQMTSGSNAGQRRTIISNTNLGRFNVNAPFFDVVGAGDTFIVQRPNVIITSPSGFLGIQASRNRVGWLGVQFDASTAFGFFVFDGAEGQYEACQILNGFVGIEHRAAELQPSPFIYNWGLANPLNPFSGDSVAVYFKNCFIQVDTHCNLQGYMVADSVDILLLSGATANIAVPSFRNSSITSANGGVSVTISGSESNGTGTVRGLFDTSDGNMFDIGDNSNLTIADCDISNSAGDAIVTRRGSTASVTDVGGTGNTGAGIHAAQISSIIVDGTTTVTGASDALVGATPATYAAIIAGPGVSDALGNRINPDTAA